MINNTPINKLTEWDKIKVSDLLIYDNNDNIVKLFKTNSNILNNLITHELSENNDVNINNLISGDFLVYENGYWVNSALTINDSNSIINLNDNLDVNTGNTNYYSFLYYNNNIFSELNLKDITYKLILNSDALKFTDNTNEYDSFNINKTLKINFDNYTGSSNFPSRLDHNHDLSYSKLSHTHPYTTTGINDTIFISNYDNPNIINKYTVTDGLITNNNEEIFQNYEIIFNILPHPTLLSSKILKVLYKQNDSPYDNVIITSKNLTDRKISTDKYILQNNNEATLGNYTIITTPDTVYVLKYPYDMNNDIISQYTVII